jgi:hypothetical protein
MVDSAMNANTTSYSINIKVRGRAYPNWQYLVDIELDNFVHPGNGNPGRIDTNITKILTSIRVKSI